MVGKLSHYAAITGSDRFVSNILYIQSEMNVYYKLFTILLVDKGLFAPVLSDIIFLYLLSRRPFHDACAKLLQSREATQVVYLLDIELQSAASPFMAKSLYLRAVVMTLGGCQVKAEMDFSILIEMNGIDSRVSLTYL